MTTRDGHNGTLASAILHLRQTLGSQRRLAEQVGVAERTVKRWERGAVPQRESRPKLIELGVDPALFERADQQEEIETRLREIEGEIARIRALRD